MSKSIVIPSNQITGLTFYYTDLLNSLNDKLTPLLKEREEIETLLLQLTGKQKLDSNEINSNNEAQIQLPLGKIEYNPNFSIPKKLQFVLSIKGKPISTTEILKEINAIEPNSPITIVNISSELSKNSNVNGGTKYYRIGEHRLEYKYGLMEWKTRKTTNNGGL